MRGSSTLTRRRMLGTLGALGVAAASGVLAAPRPARAQPLGLNESVDVAMKRVFAGRPIRDGESLIKLDIPLIAENGAVVPVSVRVDSPMTPTSYVKHIYIVADKNRIPVVTRVTLTPAAGQAFVGANIRLGKSSGPFDTTHSVSGNPVFSFAFRATDPGPLKVEFLDTTGGRYEGTVDITFA